MKASYYWLTLAVAAAAVAGRAGDPPAAGALLLDDFRIVEGRVEKFDKLYRVTAGEKSQVVSELHVLHRAATRAELYQYVTDRADTQTAAGRARLAEWFLGVGEPARAAAEAKAAAGLAPADATVKDLLRRCEQAATNPPAAPSSPGGGRQPPERDHLGGVTPPAQSLPPALVPEAAGLFAARVQPILMNVCAGCHARKDHAGAFKLTRIPEGYADAAATAANLAAVAGQLAAADPAASPLLARAVAAHGGAKLPPLPSRAHPAFRNLEAWVSAAVVPAKPVAAAAGAAPPAPPAKLPPLKAGAVVPVGPVAAAPKAGANTPRPPAANPDDPFDPAAFNRLPGAGRGR